MRFLRALAVGVAVIAGIGSIGSLAPTAARALERSAPAATTPSRVLYIAVAHPDDEFQAAAMYADRPDLYKVFVLMTRGEATTHCSPVVYGLAVSEGAPPVTPAPRGIRTASCEEARLNSWLSYFSAMSQTDTSLPGDFGPATTSGAFPAGGVSLSRPGVRPEIPSNAVIPDFTDSTARVWVDRRGRGALVGFNLGDGALTPAKAAWALRTVIGGRAALGLDTTLPDYGAVGTFSNENVPGCFRYSHRDHTAISDALRQTDLGLRFQGATTCRDDSGTTSTSTVPAGHLDAAYPADGSAGAFAQSYSWLETPVVSRADQSSLFMGVQSVDVRFQHLPGRRVSGADRFLTSVAISQASYPDGAPVVYLASGTNFPDALSAGAAAAHQGGPLLITAPWMLPGAVADEITRLHPARVVVVGGDSAVTPAVADAVAALAPDVVRLAGGDRFDTSRRVAEYAFAPGSAATAYIASGSSFPDALSATGAAGTEGAPVLLTPGGDTTGATVRATLAGLAPKRIAVVGGASVVPASLDRALTGVAPVQRLAGSDRFATNALVTAFAYDSAPSALIASGLNFPDALTGAAWAGHAHVPLLLTRGGCLAKLEADQLYTLGADSITMLGGADVVGDGVTRGATC
ncbi:cell wall-binding repeat-containing protein [Leifsonia shinshuensis]|uniref:cell wall-binding repeat-containing protein n=1 Tax=Leifsonia shinshuensis TaxID=150026 RepID=UPI00285AB3C5|nr:cell wall-binding repeat-containing protein [Leifsonia shinshuensis]MDR6971100.1 putative cell wall-binding protein [Leifsonia shinshuensis]